MACSSGTTSTPLLLMGLAGGSSLRIGKPNLMLATFEMGGVTASQLRCKRRIFSGAVACIVSSSLVVLRLLWPVILPVLWGVSSLLVVVPGGQHGRQRRAKVRDYDSVIRRPASWKTVYTPNTGIGFAKQFAFACDGRASSPDLLIWYGPRLQL